MHENVTILNFSGRIDGNCAEICSYISDTHSNSNICIYNINEYFKPCGNCNYECLRQDQTCYSCENKNEVMDAIMSSDMVYYLVPNYCGFPCANYFAFNERTVGYFNLDRALMERYMSVNKKFIIISNTESSIFLEAMQQQVENPRILYLKSRNYGKQSINGDLMDSEAAKADLQRFLNAD